MRSTEESLQNLLAFIQGAKPYEFFGQGIRTYTDRDPGNTRLHEACLELESRGLIKRYRVDGDCVLWMPIGPEPATPKHPAQFSTFCDRCKRYRADCLLIPYARPPSLTPPETEPVIGVDYITERVVIDPEDIRLRYAAMCADCRVLKTLYPSTER